MGPPELGPEEKEKNHRRRRPLPAHINFIDQRMEVSLACSGR